MKPEKPTKIKDSVRCIQYLDGDIEIKTDSNDTWLTHPKEVWKLIEWLSCAVRYMQKQWEE